MQKMPKTAIEKWRKYIEGLKRRDFFDNLRSAKLLNVLTRIPLRVTRDASQRILGGGSKIKGAMQSLINGLKNIPKKALRKWKQIVQDIKDKKLYDNTRSLKLNIVLDRIHRRTMKDAHERIKGIMFASPHIKATIKRLDGLLKKKPKEAFDRWRKYVQAINNKEIMDNVRSQKVLICLNNVAKRRLRDATQRIAGEGDKVKGAIKKIYTTMQRMPKTAIEKWRKYIEGLKRNDFFDNLRGAKLLNCLTRIPLRVIRDASQRINGDGSKVKGAIKSIVSAINNIPRLALDKWRKYVNLCKQKGILDNVRSHKLLLSMERISKSTLKDASERIIGKTFNSPKVKEGLKTMEQVLKRRPKEAFDKWNKFLKNIKDMMLLDNVRTQKLKIALTNVPRRTLRDAYQRIIGEGDKVKGALKNIVNAFAKLTKRSIEKWKQYIHLCKSKTILDNLRSEKLKSTLSKIHLRTLKDCQERIVGEGSKVKGALRRILLAGQKKPKCAFENWKKFVASCKNNSILDLVKSQKLLNAMTKIALRTLRDANIRIIGDGDTVKGAIRRIIIQLNKNTRTAYNKWRDFLAQVHEKRVFDNNRAQKLLQALEKVPRRTIKSITERILGEGNQALGALRRFAIVSQKLPKAAVELWKKYVDNCKKGMIMDNLRTYKMKDHMIQVPRKLLKEIFERIARGEKKCKDKLNMLAKIHNKKPLRACNGWKTNVEVDKVMKPLIANRLRFALVKLPLRNLRKVFEMLFHKDQAQGAIRRMFIVYNSMSKRAFANWKEYMMKCRRGDVYDMMRAQKLSTFMNRIPSRILRNSVMRVLGDGSRAIGMLRLLANKAQQRPREAIKVWRDYIDRCKRGDLFDRMRSQKLLIVMKSLTMRTLREAARGMITAQDKIKHMFRLWEVELAKNTKTVWTEWKHFVERTKRGELLDAVKTQKLRKCVENVPKRVLRDAFERVIGDGNRVKGALRRLEICCGKIRDSAYYLWKDVVIKNRTRDSLRRLKAQQLKASLQTIPQRILKDALDRIIGDGTKVLGSLRRLAISFKKIQKDAFIRWREKILNKQSCNLSKGNKIRFALESVYKRTLKGALNKILGDLRARRGVARMGRNLLNQQKSAIERVRDRVMKLRMIKKVNSAYILMKMFKLKADIMIKGRFRMWKNMESIRKLRLMRRAMMHMLFYATINFENAFWKWKFVLTIRGLDLNPKHSIMQKRLSQVAHNYQKRLEQFALFKLILFFRSTTANTQPKKPIQHIVSSLVKASRKEEIPRSPSPERKTESKIPISVRGSVSTDAVGKLSKEELIGVNQLGGAEVIALQIRNLKTRNVAIAFSNVLIYSKQVGVFDDERSRLIEQINELRYDKHSLLEDNTALRHHNEALIDNLEKTNVNFQSLSLHLDQMRLGRMVRVISKMIELPMLESLIMIKHQTGYV